MTTEPEIQDTQETEDQLIIRAQEALSRCNWVIGECASQWTQRYARGRSDADFGVLVGLSGDQVYQRRRVWESFADVHQQYPNLKWSHFYVSINWTDSAECLQWANEMEATVAEMKAWRRAQNGEDLTEPAVEEPPFAFDLSPDYITAGTGMVRDPDEFGQSPRSGYEGGGEYAGQSSDPLLAMSAPRESTLPDYAPFGKGARGPAPKEEGRDREAPSTEQIVGKACQAIERAVAVLTPEVIDQFHDLPIPLQQRLIDAVEVLQSRTAGLS